MKVLLASAEVAPFAKVGGLGDVAGTLPRALASLGHEVRVLSPLHQSARAFSPNADISFHFPFLGRWEEVRLWHGLLRDGVPVYFVESAAYFDRPSIYSQPDDLTRYLFFSRLVLEVPKRLAWRPDIYHLNDWHTAAVPPALHSFSPWDDFYRPSASVLTIHNLIYKGPDPYLDLLCQGIYYAQALNTVSPTHARELLTPEFGQGLERLLRLRRRSFTGILNGLDYQEQDPARDPNLAEGFDIDSLEKRATNKQALQQQAGLPPEKDIPLLAMVGRLAEQKGADLTVAALERLLQERPVQFINLGVGDERYQRLLEELKARYPGSIALFFSFSPRLASLIYGGADLFLMPSRYEPCGLGQLIALRYGAVPVARRTGGLADTLQDSSPDLDRGDSFLFDELSPNALLETLRRALDAYENKTAWRLLQRRGMQARFTWEASALQYQALYQKALRAKGRGR